jgi:predicted nuclease with RNAse H fold
MQQRSTKFIKFINKDKEFQSEKLFLGVDLGGEDRKTTGICLLKKDGDLSFFNCKACKVIFGRDFFKEIRPHLSKIKVIAIDAPLTPGKGKGKMRLFEKFLSTRIFREEKINPLPPALMPNLCDFAKKIKKILEKKGFILNLNLIETFPTFIEKVASRKFFILNPPCQNKHQRSAFICALLAFFHFERKARFLGYKDGLLFLPEFSLWKKDFKKKFALAWKERPRLKYRYLSTNIYF